MRIIDTHLHLLHIDKFSYPWLHNVPAINRQITCEDYFAEATPLGIEAALHMEVDVAEADMEAETAFTLDCHPSIIGAIAACRPESNDFPAYLERISSYTGVKSLRRILHTSPDELSQSELFAQNIQRLAAKDLAFDLCVRADQLPIGTQLVAKCPDVQFIMDHCGVPKVVEKELDPWRAHITEIAKQPNVVAKISGIIAYAGPDWTVEDLKPYVEHIIENFGWDRVVWGSDFPVCTLTADLTKWVNATKTIIAGASTQEQEKLLSKNAERIYKI